MKTKEKREKRMRRHRRVRGRIRGTSERPRFSVFRSNRGLSAQLIDDAAGRTVASASWKEIKEKKKAGRMSAAEKLGVLIAARAADKGITVAVFDRGAYKYHGLVRATAEGARKSGLKI